MNSQFKRGIVEMCILKVLSIHEMSAYEIIEFSSEDLEINENTIYPILRRLHNEGYLAIEKRQASMGAPRKYYTITKTGLALLKTQYKQFSEYMEKFTTAFVWPISIPVIAIHYLFTQFSSKRTNVEKHNKKLFTEAE